MDDAICVGVTEAARRLGLSRAKLYELVMAGEVPSLLVGTRRLLVVRQLVAWAENAPRAASK